MGQCTSSVPRAAGSHPQVMSTVGAAGQPHAALADKVPAPLSVLTCKPSKPDQPSIVSVTNMVSPLAPPSPLTDTTQGDLDTPSPRSIDGGLGDASPFAPLGQTSAMSPSGYSRNFSRFRRLPETSLGGASVDGCNTPVSPAAASAGPTSPTGGPSLARWAPSARSSCGGAAPPPSSPSSPLPPLVSSSRPPGAKGSSSFTAGAPPPLTTLLVRKAAANRAVANRRASSASKSPATAAAVAAIKAAAAAHAASTAAGAAATAAVPSSPRSPRARRRSAGSLAPVANLRELRSLQDHQELDGGFDPTSPGVWRQDAGAAAAASGELPWTAAFLSIGGRRDSVGGASTASDSCSAGGAPAAADACGASGTTTTPQRGCCEAALDSHCGRAAASSPRVSAAMTPRWRASLGGASLGGASLGGASRGGSFSLAPTNTPSAASAATGGGIGAAPFSVAADDSVIPYDVRYDTYDLSGGEEEEWDEQCDQDGGAVPVEPYEQLDVMDAADAAVAATDRTGAAAGVWLRRGPVLAAQVAACGGARYGRVPHVVTLPDAPAGTPTCAPSATESAYGEWASEEEGAEDEEQQGEEQDFEVGAEAAAAAGLLLGGAGLYDLSEEEEDEEEAEAEAQAGAEAAPEAEPEARDTQSVAQEVVRAELVDPARVTRSLGARQRAGSRRSRRSCDARLTAALMQLGLEAAAAAPQLPAPQPPAPQPQPPQEPAGAAAAAGAAGAPSHHSQSYATAAPAPGVPASAASPQTLQLHCRPPPRRQLTDGALARFESRWPTQPPAAAGSGRAGAGAAEAGAAGGVAKSAPLPRLQPSLPRPPSAYGSGSKGVAGV